MKRKAIVALLAAIMVMASSALCFAEAGGLKLESSYPEDGQKNTSIENVGVKLHFNGTFADEAVQKANAKRVKIVDADGKAVDTEVKFSSKDKGLVLVVAMNDKAAKITGSKEYKLVIDEDFADDNGNTIGEKTTVAFTTYNQKLNNMINIIMMVVMFGGIMVLTVKQQRDQQAEKEEAAKKDTKEAAFNPYREAKKTGKSVEEVMAEEAKRQEKANKKKKKKAKPDTKHVKITRCSDYLNNVYHVREPRPIKKEAKTTKNSKSGKGGNK